MLLPDSEGFMAGDMHLSPCLCYFSSSGLGFFRPSQQRGEQESGAEDDWASGGRPVGFRLNQPTFSDISESDSQILPGPAERGDGCSTESQAESQKTFHSPRGDLAPQGAGGGNLQAQTVFTRALPRLRSLFTQEQKSRVWVKPQQSCGSDAPA